MEVKMRRILEGIIVSVLMVEIGSVACAANGAGTLYAGTAKVNISPDQPVISAAGMSFRLPDTLPEEKTPPTNLHDPLYARIVVFKSGETALAIVSLDLQFFSSEKLIAEAKEKWKVDHVILSSSHTHSGMVPRAICPTKGGWAWAFVPSDPREKVDWPGLSKDPWYAVTEEKIVAAIGEAMRNLFPARLAVAEGPYESVYLGHNRRFVRPDGRVTMMWANPKRIPTKPRDSTVGVIRIEDEAGKPRALMVHYACHPVTMMGNPMITADFPGAMVDYIEKELGPDCMGMFLQGAEGDIDPYEMRLRGDYGFNMVQQSGVALAKAALRVAADMPSPNSSKGSLQVKEEMLDIPYRTGDKSTDACIATVVVNDALALVAIPGEPFIQHQLNLRERSPLPHTFMLGLAYSGRGSPCLIYVPTAQAVKEGGYAATQASFVAADTGARMVNAAVESLKAMSGIGGGK